MLISKESFSLRELENFVHRSPLTLKIWPWLNDYELLSNMANVRKKYKGTSLLKFLCYK